jgi:hypothetical protein
VFDLKPLVVFSADFFAIAADGKKPAKLSDFGLQTENAVRNMQPGRQLVRIERFRQEIVHPGFHPLEVVCFSTKGGD